MTNGDAVAACEAAWKNYCTEGMYGRDTSDVFDEFKAARDECKRRNISPITIGGHTMTLVDGSYQ